MFETKLKIEAKLSIERYIFFIPNTKVGDECE